MFREILIWWLVIQALGALALPLTTFLFRALPDRGYAFSKSLGLLLTGFGAWFAAMLGLGSFGAPLLAAVALLMGGLGLLISRKTGDRETGGRQTSQPSTFNLQPSTFNLQPPTSNLQPSTFNLQPHLLPWRTILVYEALFVAALVFTAWMRSYNPTPWGTERPMDFAFFNAIQRSASFPPHDPWLAGFSINYYYFGYLLMAVMATLSGIEPGAAYNLALALIFALTALGIAGIVRNLIALTLVRTANSEQRIENNEHRTRNRLAVPFGPSALLRAGYAQGRLGSLFAVLLAVVFVLFAGNQAGALQVIVGSERVVALDGTQLAAALSQALAGADQITLPYPVERADDFGTFATLERADKAADFNWWWPSRALWDRYVQTGEQGAQANLRYNITEFPFFSFWLGDMHPHVMALPFGLLAAALALATLARPTAPNFAIGRRGWAELLLHAIVLGSLYTINSWDLPTYLLLYLGALLLLYLRLAGGQWRAILWRHLGQQAATLVVFVFVLFAPFFLTFHSLVGAAAPLVDLPIVGGLTRTIAPFAGGRSGLHAFLVIFGLFAVPLVAFVYLSRGKDDGRQPPGGELLAAVSSSRSAVRWLPAAAYLPWLPPILLLAGLLLGFPLLALLGLGLLALAQLPRRLQQPAESYALLGVALGCAVVFGAELIYIRDVFSSRMNTIFKFYYQIWLIWGTLAAYALWWALARTGGARRIAAFVAGGLTLILLAGALVYPAINLRDMVARGAPAGLDGKTPRQISPAGAASIDWLRRHVAPGAVVLEMVAPDPCGGSYNGAGYGGVSASSGLPTVLGWICHQHQWRGGDPDAQAQLEPRRAAVDQIYATIDPQQARDLLKQYNVRYVYVGALERQHYPAESLAKFAQLGAIVFQQDEVTIYRLR